MNAYLPVFAKHLPCSKVQTKLAMRDAAHQALDAGVLFAGGSEVVIQHGDEVYRLRLTRQNKLILTK